MPRVLHIIDSLNYSGTTTQLLVLCQGLVECGFEVHVAALGSHGIRTADFQVAGVPVTQLDRRWTCDPTALLRLQRLIYRLRPDVVHTWDAASGVYGRLAAREPSVLVSCHRVDPWCGNGRWQLERWLAHHTQRYIVSSKHLRNWFVQHGLPADKFVVIPPGVPPAPGSDLSREELLRELKLPSNARLIGVVGRLTPEKRVKDLIWAADLLRVLHNNLRLLVIGDGPERPQLEQYAQMASDLDHIQFLGERADVSCIMPHLDVLWNADEPRGHAITILEAMAAGVPVIASDTAFNRELVIENETGYLIPLYQRAGRATRARHTDQLFTDRRLAARLASASHQRVAECFVVKRLVQRYVEQYETTVGAPAACHSWPVPLFR